MINKSEFLAEYEALCRKYNLYIGACKVCGMTWVIDANKDEIDEEMKSLIEIDPDTH